MAPATVQPHHHRSTTKQAQKPFKARHATKSALKEKSKGKIERLEKGSRKTPHQHIMSKLDRRNKAKQLRLNNNNAHAEKTSIFSGRNAAPRIVAVVPLGGSVDTVKAVQSLSKSVDVEEMIDAQASQLQLNVERFKQKLHFIMAKPGLFTTLDACRLADFVVFVMSAEQEADGERDHLIKTLESQGISNVMATVQGLDDVEPAKRRPQLVASLKSYISYFFPTIEKVTSLDSRQEALNLTRSLCTVTPKGVRWREERSWMLVEHAQWPTGKQAQSDEGKGELVVTGVVRGQSLHADRLVRVGDWGEFQIDRVVAAPLSPKKRANVDSEMQEETQNALEIPSADQDDLLDLAPEEIVMQVAPDLAPSVAASTRKGVLLDDHHYFSDEEEYEVPRRKQLPKGTSQYQAAWYLDDIDYSGSDLEDAETANDDDVSMMGGPVEPADGIEGLAGPEGTEFGASEYPESEMLLDEAPDAEELEAYRASRKGKDADDDVEFPDEIELHPHVLARERLARYRGLKSARTSVWDTTEDAPYEPAEWQRLLTISDYKAAKAKVTRDSFLNGVKAGTRVSIHLRNVPLSIQEAQEPSTPLAIFQLLKHEHKRVAANYSITLSSDLENPIKSKEPLIMQIGPRRLAIRPLFSQQGTTPNDVHKFERFLHPGRSAIASTIAPLTWGSVPVLYFRPDSATQQLHLVGTGTSLPPSRSRVIAKRVILTGHPYKIHKRVVTVRYMFFNKEDVDWFKSMPLWTKRGKSGFVRESLGTHGYFKAVFDGKINPMDAIGVSLWKRCWPRMAQEWQPGQLLEGAEATDDLEDMQEAPDLV